MHNNCDRVKEYKMRVTKTNTKETKKPKWRKKITFLQPYILSYLLEKN